MFGTTCPQPTKSSCKRSPSPALSDLAGLPIYSIAQLHQDAFKAFDIGLFMFELELLDIGKDVAGR